MSPHSEPPDRLPCGVDLDSLIEQVAGSGGSDFSAHQLSCTHCQASLAEIDRLWSPISELAVQRIEPPQGLVDSVMTLVRDLALEVWHIVLPGERGQTRIAARVIAAIARKAASRTPGVRVVLGRSSQARLVAEADAATRTHRQPHSAVGLAGQHAVIDLAVVSSFGQVLPAVAREIRQNVRSDLEALTDVHGAQVNIYLDDLLEAPDEQR